MKRMIWILPIFLGLSFKAQGAPRVLTLDESISMAVKGASSVLKADSDAGIRGEQLIQSYLQWLPNLSVQANYNAARGRSYLTTAAPTLVKTSSYGASYQVTSVLNIFNGLNDISAYQSIRDKTLAADRTLDRAKQQVALDVAQSFLQVILDGKLATIAENNSKISIDRQKSLEAQSKVGTRSLADFFRQQAQTSIDESALIAAKNRYETDKIVLLRKLRLDPRTEVSFQEPVLEQKVKVQDRDIDTLIDEALKNRPDYEASQRLATATEKDVSVAEAAYYPRLDFITSYGSLARNFDFQRVNGVDVTPAQDDPLSDQLADHANYTYGLSLTWNIFDRGTARSSVAATRGSAFRAKLDAEDYRNQVVGEVKQVVNDRTAAVQQMTTSQAGLIAAQKSFEVSQGRYEVGSLSLIDLSASQVALFQAQTNYIQATIAYELQKRAMAYALGSIL